jgi:hypothetical protein
MKYLISAAIPVEPEPHRGELIGELMRADPDFDCATV